MDGKEFRIEGKAVIDYIVDYLENIRDRRVFPDKKPGYIHDQIPDAAPVEGEKWSDIFKDMESIIMPGVTHWQSPQMHAYFPALNSYPSMLGEMLTNAINCIGFTWASSPACTELEMVVMNWLGKMIGLPEDYLHKKGGSGGGVIQTTASESTLISLLAGRYEALKLYMDLYPEASKHEIHGKLVAYCSDQAHSSIEKAALIGLVTLRYIESDENYSMRGPDLLKAIKEDREKGLIPFWVCATLGTTGSCAFDNLEEITQVSQNELMWCHVDAAYAGSAFICPEYRVWLKGIDKANSIALNPSKWMMVHFDCTAMWVKNSGALHGAFNVNPLYLTHEYSGLAIDFMHWQIPLSKRFRSLKLWFVIRNYGITGLQKHIRKGVYLAGELESLIRKDSRFEIPANRYLGLVVFRLVGDNMITETLWKKLNARGKIHCVPASLRGKYVIRFTVTSPRTTMEDISADWKEIMFVADEVLSEKAASSASRAKVPLGAMRRRIRGILMSGKQFSLDSRLDLFHGIEPSRSETFDNLPLLEDSNEIEESNCGSTEFPYLQSPLSDSLDIMETGQSRSKSVDHQIVPSSCLEINKQVCIKCGHHVNGYSLNN
ncbi:histidine decarboxylase isoform X2 [Leptinotarsa decemlineata]|uniref:histidine decarboxylase isoform X2 n=1 Tax=Leptinotarsa decemlineata TaxID=7539 RepID=UPI003D30426D